MGISITKAIRTSVNAALDGSQAATTFYSYDIPPGMKLAVISVRPGDRYRVDGQWYGWSANCSDAVLWPLAGSRRDAIWHSRDGAIEFIPNEAKLVGKDGGSVVSDPTVQVGTSAPTLVTQGQDLLGAVALRATAYADSGQTISAVGTLKFYYWDTALGFWMENPTLALPGGVTGARGEAFPDREIHVPYGRVCAVYTGTVSSGSINTSLRVVR